MRTNPQPRILLLALLCALPLAASAADTTAGKPEAAAPAAAPDAAVFDATILQVHHFVDAGSEYVAYTVNWNGREIFITPRSGSDEEPLLKIGDTLRCRKLMIANQKDPAAPARLVFVKETSATQEAKRLEKVAEEVRRRRAARNEADAKAQGQRN